MSKVYRIRATVSIPRVFTLFVEAASAEEARQKHELDDCEFDQCNCCCHSTGRASVDVAEVTDPNDLEHARLVIAVVGNIRRKNNRRGRQPFTSLQKLASGTSVVDKDD